MAAETSLIGGGAAHRLKDTTAGSAKVSLAQTCEGKIQTKAFAMRLSMARQPWFDGSFGHALKRTCAGKKKGTCEPKLQ